MRDRIRRDQNLFFPKIVEQEGLKRRAIVERLSLVSRLTPVHGKVAVNDANAIVDDLAGLGKIVAANVLVDVQPPRSSVNSSMSQVSVSW